MTLQLSQIGLTLGWTFIADDFLAWQAVIHSQ
jgi:hypothetical protein